VLVRLAERAGQAPVALSRGDCAAILGLADEGTQALDVGGGVRAVAEYGALRFQLGTPDPRVAPDAVPLNVPGEAEFGDWEVFARVEKVAQAAGGGFLPARGDALLSTRALEPSLTIRAWRHGDRMQPAGLDGTKTLADLFTDNKVPREQRDQVPVVECGGEIVWVAGLAVGEDFRAAPDESEVVILSAKRRT
jgi:tRNA(Ile)-lysidine synthase